MNKKLLELLNQINDQKKKVIDLANEGKLDEAKTAKAELQKLQDRFDLLKDIEDPEPVQEPGNNGQNPVNNGDLRPVNLNFNHAVHDFADAARHYFRNATANTEGSKADGGYTVPEDIQTEINRYREETFSLQSLVDTENVSTNSGTRTYQSFTDWICQGGRGRSNWQCSRTEVRADYLCH